MRGLDPRIPFPSKNSELERFPFALAHGNRSSLLFGRANYTNGLKG
jgi:hypothetical protein